MQVGLSHITVPKLIGVEDDFWHFPSNMLVNHVAPKVPEILLVLDWQGMTSY